MSRTYQDPELVDVVYRKTVALRDGPAVPLDALAGRLAAGLMAQPRVVFDIGGACGASYYRLRPFITWDLTWHVIETPAMAERARNLEDDHLRFHSAMPDQSPDFVVASGVMQYFPDPLAALTELTALRAPVLLVSRTALSDREVRMVQRSRLAENGPGPLPAGIRDREVAYPLVAAPREAFERIFAAAYDLTAFEEGEVMSRSRFGPTITQYGWLGRLRESPTTPP